MGVYLPPGSPAIQLTVSDYDGPQQYYQGTLTPGETTDDAAKCQWGAYVGEAAPSDPLIVSLPANVPLRFEFSPASDFYDTFEYQLCRGPGAPFGTFRCPQNAATADPAQSRTLLTCDASFRGASGFRVRTGPFGDQPGESVDDELNGERWVLPYDAEYGCTQAGCGSQPDIQGTPACDPEVVEKTPPYMRRIEYEAIPPGVVESNNDVRWVIRDDQDVQWSSSNVPEDGFAFGQEMCVQVRGDLDIKKLDLAGGALNPPDKRWLGISVEEDGGLVMTESSVTGVRTPNLVSVSGAIRSAGSGATITLDQVNIFANSTNGVYVGGGASVEMADSFVRFNEHDDLPNEELAGVWVDSGSSALLQSSRFEGNRGSGVRVSGYGSHANLDEIVSVTNGAFGVQADDFGEVFFGPVAPNPIEPSLVSDNLGGGLAALTGGDVIAGISDGSTCRRYCNNNILRNDNAGGVDVRALDGSVVFAEADYWGHLNEVDLVLDDDASSDIYVQPLLQQPPSATAPFVAAKGSGRGDHSPAAAVRAHVALGKVAEASSALLDAWARIETDADRDATFSAATVLLARAQPEATLGWILGRAAVPGPDQEWAQWAGVVGLTSTGRQEEARSLAERIVEGRGSREASGHLALVRIALVQRDLDGALAAYAQLVRRHPETSQASRARTLLQTAYPGADLPTDLAKGVETASATAAPHSGLRAYPNPTHGKATLAIDLESREGDVTVSVFDVTGRRVLHRRLGSLDAGPHSIPLPLSAFPAGVYAVRVDTSGAASEATRVTLIR